MKKVLSRIKEKIKDILNFTKKHKKKVLIGLAVFIILFLPTFLYINLTNPTLINKYIASVVNKGMPANNAFEDQVFYNAVVDEYNRKNDTNLPYTTNLTDEQLKTITKLSDSSYNEEDSEKISSVKGIEKLTSLSSLVLRFNNFDSIDLSENTLLTDLNLSSNNLSNIDLSKNTLLTDLNLSGNDLSNIDLSKNTLLTDLDLRFNNLDSIDLSKNTKLTDLNLSGNDLSNIDLSNNTLLTTLYLSGNDLSNIDLSNNTSLTDLDLSGNDLSNIDLSNNTSLKNLDLSYNNLSGIDLSKNTSLTDLDLSSNNLSNIDLSNNTSLTYLNLNYNDLSNIDLSNNTSLTDLDLWYNNLSNIDLSNNTSLTNLNLTGNNLSSINLSKNTKLRTLDLYDNNLSNIDLSKNTSLTDLDLCDNNLSNIDLSNNTKLTNLNLSSNNLSNIDLSKNTKLTNLYLFNNSFDLGTYRMMLGTTLNSDNNIKLPEDSDKFYITYGVEDEDIASYKDGVIKGLKEGTTKLKLTLNGVRESSSSSSNMVVDGVIKVFDIKSSKYKIDKESKYIYAKTDIDNNTILKNITVENGTGKIENNEFKVMDEDVVVETYKIVNISSNEYNLTKDYIYTGINAFDKSKINCLNCTSEVSGNTLNIKYNNEVIDSYKLVSISSDKYDLSKDYIYTGYNSFNSDDIKIKNGSVEVSNNNINIKYNNEVLDSYKLVSYSSSKYNLDKEYIYVGTNEFSKDDISLINLTSTLSNNTLQIKYGNEVKASYKIVSISSNKYDLSKDNIRLKKDETFDIQSVNITNGQLEYRDNKLYVKYGNDVLKVYTITNRAKGDVNNDDKITVVDVSLLYRHVKKKSVITDSETLSISDINADNKITVTDVSMIYRYVKGKIDEL